MLRFGPLLLATVVFGAKDTGEKDDAVRKEQKKLQGTWQRTRLERAGKPSPQSLTSQGKLIFKANKVSTMIGTRKTSAATIKLFPSRNPREIDMTPTMGLGKGRVIRSIYQLEGDTLTLCFIPEGNKRPRDFSSEGAAVLQVFERVKR
jgi:uncharacterized protein (TIGR03067 family)